MVVERVKNDQKLEDCTIEGDGRVQVRDQKMMVEESEEDNEQVFVGVGKKL